VKDYPHDLWWRAAIAVSVIVMALVDAITTTRSHLKVETWVLLLFVDVVITIALLNRRYSRMARLKLLGWFVACLVCLYSFVWSLVVVFTYHSLPVAVALYPFAVSVPFEMLWVLMGVGAWLGYLTRHE
jgi:hypothetical protein